MAKSSNFTDKIRTFYALHPIISHILLIIVATIVMLMLINVFLKMWSRHDKTFEVPNVIGYRLDDAAAELRAQGFEVAIDSLFVEGVTPGEVIDQSPREKACVKEGRTIYLRYACFQPKMVTMPDYYTLSGLETESKLRSLGIRNLTMREVPSSMIDLTLGVRYNGIMIRPGELVPVTASLVIEVGASDHDSSGIQEELILPEQDDAIFIEELQSEYGF